MSTSLVLTVIGHDRPGLVESLSQTLTAHDASWLESRMSRLAGKFAGILRVSVPASRADVLTGALLAHGAEGLKVIVERGLEDDYRETRRLVQLELLGADRPGIVRQISEALALMEVNVEELESECVKAPMCGETLFKASMQLSVPRGISVEDLRHSLEALADELMVDLMPEDSAIRDEELCNVY